MNSVRVAGFGISAPDSSWIHRAYAGIGENGHRSRGGDDRDYHKVRWPDPLTVVALRASRRTLGLGSDACAVPADLDNTDVIVCTDCAGRSSRSSFRDELEASGGRTANPS